MGQYWIWIAIFALVVGLALGQLIANSRSQNKSCLACSNTNIVCTQHAQGNIAQLKQVREKKQQDFDKIKKNFESSKISSKEYEDTATKLQQEMQLLDLKLTSEIQKRLLDCIKQASQKCC